MSKNKVVPISDYEKITISCGTSAGSGRVTNRNYTWPELLGKLSAPIRTPETVEEYRAMSPKDRGRIKDVGYFIGGASIDGGRSAKSIPLLEFLSLDADKAPVKWLESLMKKDYEWIAYTTHSHRESAPRVRVIVPCSRKITQAEHAYIIRVVAAGIGEKWFDPSGFRPTQPMFWPSVSCDGAFLFETSSAGLLKIDPDKIFAKNPDWTDRQTWPILAGETLNIGKKAGKSEDPTEKKGLVGAFCRAYDIRGALERFLPDAYAAGDDEDRFTYAEGSTVNGAIVYGGGLWLYSHHGSDPIHGRLVNAFDLVRIHKFSGRDVKASPGTPSNRLPSFLAMAELCRGDPEVRREMHKERLAESLSEFQDAPEWDDNWLEKLTIDKTGHPRPTYLNCVLILENDPRLSGCAGKNLFTGAVDQRGPLPGVAREGDGEWGEAADGFLREFFEREYRIVFPAGTINDALKGYAVKKAYHPVRDWFTGLEWDGVPRAETLFIDYLGAADSRYARAVCRKMLLAAYWRIFEPGTKFDYVVILEGAQGIQKSTFWNVLSKNRSTELSSFDPKVAGEIVQGVQFVEVAELDGFSRFDQRQLKAFFSKTADRYREAYATRAQSRPRQCIFVGSTNDDEYLSDRTGNRRYWPIRCTRTEDDPIDMEKLRAEVDQIWAEVAILAPEREPLYLDNSDRVTAEDEQRARLFADEWEGKIDLWLSRPAIIDRYKEGGEFSTDTEDRNRVCIPEIWAECFGGDIVRIDNKSRRRLADCLRAVGWKMTGTRRFGKYGRQKAFEPITPF